MCACVYVCMFVYECVCIYVCGVHAYMRVHAHPIGLLCMSPAIIVIARTHRTHGEYNSNIRFHAMIILVIYLT